MKDVTKLLKDLVVNEEIKDKLSEIYETHNSKIKTTTEKIKASVLVDEVLLYLFGCKYSSEYFIPSSFLETELGKILFEVKFSYQYYFTTSDMEILSGKTKSFLYYNLEKNKLNLIVQGTGYVCTQMELKKFLVPKYFTAQEYKKRIEAFWIIKNSSDRKIDKEEFEELFIKYLNGIDIMDQLQQMQEE